MVKGYSDTNGRGEYTDSKGRDIGRRVGVGGRNERREYNN